MKRLLGLVLPLMALFFSEEIRATHLSGAEITYLHSPTASRPDRYEIFMTLYRDANGATLDAAYPVCFSSSCNTFTSVLTCADHPYFYRLSSTGDTLVVNCGDDVPEQSDCAEPASTNVSGTLFTVRTYRGFVDLTPCVNWTMQWDLCCRNGAITNGFANDDFSISSYLNNSISHNSSPQFLKPGIKRFCVVDINGSNPKPFNWDHPVIEPDGDSIYYRFSTPQEQVTGACPVVEGDLLFSAPNSETNPMPTHNGFAIDRKFGFFTFMPSLAGVYVVCITVEEYRFNATTLAYELIGSVRRDMQIPVDAGCIATVQDGPRLNYDLPQYTTRCLDYDSISSIIKTYRPNLQDSVIVNNDIDEATLAAGDTCYILPVIDYSCNNRFIELSFQTELFCPTIDVTDLLLIGPDGISRPIQEIESGCTSTLRETRTIRLVLHQTLDVNGEYLLYFKTGNDGNTMENKCGYEIDDNYYCIVKVEDCPEIKYDLKNVTVLEDEHIKLEYEFDTTTFDTTTFRGLNIFRANNDQNFQLVGIQQDVQERSFIDSTVDAYAVDNQIYQYLLQMVTNFNARTPTNFVNSIVLKGDTADGYFDLQWNELFNSTYKDLPEYEVFVGEYDSTVGTVSSFTSVQAVGTSLSYSYEIPEEDGTYVLMVEATDPSDSNEYIAQSNWIILGKETPAVIPADATPAVTYVPNVITPNGDNINDRFYFTVDPTNLMLRSYSNLSLSIFNRWGKQVFQDDNYMERNNKAEGWDGKNDQTGSTLADGVYFYVAKFSDVTTGKSEERNGTVTLSASR